MHDPTPSTSSGAASAEPTPPPAARGPMARKGARPSLWDAMHATRAAKFARLGTFLTVVAFGATWLVYQRTEAQLGDDLLEAGEGLMRFAEPRREEGARIFRINGEVVHATTGSTERSVSALVDWYEELCLARDAQLTEQASEIAAASPNDHRSARFASFSPVIRRLVGEEAGVVACLDMGEARRTPSELVEAFGRYRESHDLGELGEIRYLYARRTSGGYTQFISVWTEGSFNVEHALPDAGDAPGDDLASVPRAPGSRRVLSAWEEGRDERYVHYVGSTMTEWELEAFYARTLEENGWVVTPDLDAEGAENATVVAMREGRQLYVLLDTAADGRGTASLMLTE